jgi:3-oxoacyl-[acyl-carrier protein] reductase
LHRQWACELGRHGIRVVTLKTGGVPESISDGFRREGRDQGQYRAGDAARPGGDAGGCGQRAAFVVSDLARTITSTEVNIACGVLVD